MIDDVRETSLAAWHNIVPLLSKKRGYVYRCLLTDAHRYGGSMTSAEVCAVTHRTGLWKRMSELVRLGVVEECEARPCTVTEHHALTYRVIPGAMPNTSSATPRRLPTPEGSQLLEAALALHKVARQQFIAGGSASGAVVAVAEWLEQLAKR